MAVWLPEVMINLLRSLHDGMEAEVTISKLMDFGVAIPEGLLKYLSNPTTPSYRITSVSSRFEN